MFLLDIETLSNNSLSIYSFPQQNQGEWGGQKRSRGEEARMEGGRGTRKIGGAYRFFFLRGL